MLTYNEDSITTPYDEVDYCLHLSSTSDNDTYRLNNMPTIPGDYTFSVWGKSTEENIIDMNILGVAEIFTLSSSWNKIKTTVTSDGTQPYIDIILPANIEIWLYEGQLEDGDVATSWHSSPEDTNESIEKTKEYVNTLFSELEYDTSNIKDTILSWTNGALGKDTYILGGLIKTNTITAEKIALGDFVNYASWKDKTIDTCPFSYIGDNWDIDTSVYRTSTASYHFTTTDVSTSSKIEGITVPVNKGEQIYVEFWYKTDPEWTCDASNSKMRITKSDGSLLKSFSVSNTENTEWTKVSGIVYISDASIGPYIKIQIYMKGTTLEKQIWIDDVLIKKMSSGELIVDGSITANKISVDTLEAICAKIGGFTIGSNAIYNGTSSLSSTIEGIYLGTDGIRNYKNENTYVDIKNGVLTANNANISGTIITSDITASGGTIAGWNITDGKIYSGDTSTGVAVMQRPQESITYVFAAGGTSHESYKDCPFRVTKNGKVYANRLYITGDSDTDSGEGFYIYDPANSKYLNFARCDGGIEFPAFYYHFTGGLAIDKLESDLLFSDDNTYKIGSSSKSLDTIYSRAIRIGQSVYDTDGFIYALYKDGENHRIVERSSDGLTSSFGWIGDSTYKSVTKLRGQTIQYVNSSGTTTLSDVRMKKDFKDLNTWEDFYANTEPCAFKYVDGASSRYHIGFKAQQIKTALESSGLTTQDFAGYVQYDVDPLSDEWHGYDIEYGLIYTEFIALNTYMIQKLMNRVNELENKFKEVVSMYGI